MFNKYIGIVVAVAVLAVQGFYYSGKVRALTAEYNALQLESDGLRVALQASQTALITKTKTDIKQSTVRAKASKSVQAVVQENRNAAIQESPVVLPSAILSRLRQLVKTGNTAIDSAGDSL